MKETDNNEMAMEDVEATVSYDSTVVKKIWWGSVVPVLREHYYLVVDNILLFSGVVLMSSSILDFNYGRYCDGMRSDNYACVNSATVYEYSKSTIFLFVFGVVCVTLWYVKRNSSVVYEE